MTKHPLVADTWKLLKGTYHKFLEDEPLNYAAIIAFYTIFSLPAVIIFIILVASFFMEESEVRYELYGQVSELMGPDTAEQLKSITSRAQEGETTRIMTIIGVATLMFSATTVFVSIQNALNSIWGVRPKPKKGFIKFVIDRVMSFATVASLGFVMLVSLLLDALLSIFSDLLTEYLSSIGAVLIYLTNLAVSLAAVTLIFAIVFKVLPDVIIKWRHVWKGAFVTACLFTLGKFGIGFYLGTSDLGSTYGAAGSVVLMLVWVYYSSVILLVGAEFTQVFINQHGYIIRPASNTVGVVVKEIPRDEYVRMKMEEHRRIREEAEKENRDQTEKEKE